MLNSISIKIYPLQVVNNSNKKSNSFWFLFHWFCKLVYFLFVTKHGFTARLTSDMFNDKSKIQWKNYTHVFDIDRNCFYVNVFSRIYCIIMYCLKWYFKEVRPLKLSWTESSNTLYAWNNWFLNRKCIKSAVKIVWTLKSKNGIKKKNINLK